jgi:hypothetical protein
MKVRQIFVAVLFIAVGLAFFSCGMDDLGQVEKAPYMTSDRDHTDPYNPYDPYDPYGPYQPYDPYDPYGSDSADGEAQAALDLQNF